MEACKNICQALDIALDVMRKTPHTLSKKSATESPYSVTPYSVKEIRNRQNSDSTGSSPPQMDQQQNNTGLLTTIAGNMTDAEVERVIEDARRANTEVQISGNNGMVSQNNYNTPNGGEVEDDLEKTNIGKNSELELLGNLSSSTNF